MAMASFKGQYLDGMSSDSHLVEVSFADANFVIQDARFAKSTPIKSLRVSDRLGRLPRTLILPDGSSVTLPDSALLSQLLGETGSFLQKMESGPVYAALGIALLALCGVVFYFSLLPWLSDAVARNLSPAMQKKLAAANLESMDKAGIWSGSKLGAGRDSLAIGAATGKGSAGCFSN